MMSRKSLFSSRLLWKINLIFLAIVLVSALLVGIFSARRIRQTTLDEVRENLKVRTALVAEFATPLLTAGREKELREKIRALGRECGTRLTIILADGRVAADSEKDPAAMDNHSDRPEIRAAALYGHGAGVRFSHTLKTGMMYFARALHRDHQLIGYARAALPLDTIASRIRDSREVIILGLAIIAGLVLLAAWFMGRWFIRPLVTMTAMAEALADGDFSRRLHLKRRDEIGRLAKSFNQVAENSRRRLATIAFDREKLDAILSGMSEGVIAVDERERIIHLNRAAAGFLQIDSEKAAGRPLWEVVRLPELLELVRATLQPEKTPEKAAASPATPAATAATSASATSEPAAGNPAPKLAPADKKRRRLMTVNPGPGERILELHATPLKNRAGGLSGCVVVLLDITELRRLETVRRDFVVNASHELKTPITAIRGLSETLLDDFPAMDDETRLAFIARIHAQVLRLSAVTTDLMTLSRFEREESVETREVVELNDLAATAAADLMENAAARQIDLTFNRCGEELEVEGDREGLLQAVVNLLDNAVKYTPEGGRVEISLQREDSRAIIEVKDTGIGIDPADRQRIFERFYRVDKARSRELGGTGLGLSIVRHVALSHNGRIAVESTPGQGSTFRLILPLG